MQLHFATLALVLSLGPATFAAPVPVDTLALVAAPVPVDT